jgi:hypothetical protein
MSKQRLIVVIVGLWIVLLLTSLPTFSQTFGTGWTAAYWNTTSPTGAPNFSEFLPNGINFNWGLSNPAPGINVDNWSARFASVQQFNAGTYEFVVTADDGVRVTIDGAIILDRFSQRNQAVTDRFQQVMTAGVHSLQVEFVDFVGPAVLQFQWFQAGVGITPGISTPFVTPFGTPFFTAGPTFTPFPTGPQAVLAGVRGLALRSGPYLGASYITTLLPDTAYTVLGRNRDEGIYNWYLLQVGGRTGWASGRYLSVSLPTFAAQPTAIPGFFTPVGTPPLPATPILISTMQVDVNSIPVMGSIFDQIDDAPDIGARVVTRAVMNVRRRPSTRSPEIGEIPWGGMAQLIGRTVQAGENQWLHVRYFDEAGNTLVGWIDSRWVTIQGEIYNVPIR